MKQRLLFTGLAVAALLLALLGWTFSLGRIIRARLAFSPERSVLR